MLNCKLPSLSAKDSFAMVLLHWFRPLGFGAYPSLADLLCGNTVLKSIVLLLKHPRKSGVMVLQSGIVCSSDRGSCSSFQGGSPGNQYCMQTRSPCGIALSFLGLAWGAERSKNLHNVVYCPWSKGHSPRSVSHSMCLQMSLHTAFLTCAGLRRLLHQMAGKQAYRKGDFSPNICLWRQVEGWIQLWVDFCKWSTIGLK